MKVRQAPLLLLSALFAAMVAAYLFAQVVVQKLTASGKVSLANECTDADSASQKENVNKALFVSCGGFIE